MRYELGVRQESTGWRDEWISKRHRSWGMDCPATDIDFLMVEYDHREPVALVEYKTLGSLDQIGIERALLDHYPVSKLATLAGLPSLIVGYDSHDVTFRVRATNAVAEHIGNGEALMGTRWWRLSEKEYVRLLYLIRKRVLPAEIEARLSK
jgi:hypothetical protein